MKGRGGINHHLLASMADPNMDVIDFEHLPYLRTYKSGRIERLQGTGFVPAGVDPLTGVTSKDVIIDTTTNLSARLYIPSDPNTTMNKKKKKLPILVYFHGGGFINNSPFSATYHHHLNLLTSKSTVLAVSVNYRLAPEHPLPAAYHDSWAALKWAVSPAADTWLSDHGDPDRVFVAGDSAGGNIAHHVAVRAGKEGVHLEGVVLVHPFFWGAEPIGEETRDPWKRALVDSFWRVASPETEGADDVMICPPPAAAAEAAAGCRRVMVCVAGEDVLRERGRAYYEAVREKAELVESEGEDHVFHLGRPTCENAVSMMEQIVAFVNK